MASVSQVQPSYSLDYENKNRRATVRYRCPSPTPGRAFIANSSKSVNAWVIDISLGGIGLILECHIEEGTLLRIEMGQGEKEVLAELLAYVAHNTPLLDGRWRSGCEWVRPMTEDELQVLR